MKSRQSIFKKYVFKIFSSNVTYVGFKSIVHNQHLEYFYRYFAFYTYVSRHSRSFRTKLKPVCMVTGRSRGLLNSFCLSRMIFKEYAIAGNLFGFKKSQWLNRLISLFLCLTLVCGKQSVEYRLRTLRLTVVFSTFFLNGAIFLTTEF